MGAPITTKINKNRDIVKTFTDSPNNQPKSSFGFSRIGKGSAALEDENDKILKHFSFTNLVKN